MSTKKHGIPKRPNSTKKAHQKYSKPSPFLNSNNPNPFQFPAPAPAAAKTNPHNSPKSNQTKTHRRTVSDTTNLAPLQGKLREKAPKVYENQIFRDIYDEFGNHDRVIDTVESIEIYEEVNKGSVLTFNNKSDLTTEKLIQPDESYKSFEVTSKIMKDELLEKLKEIKNSQKNNPEELFKRINIEKLKETKKEQKMSNEDLFKRATIERHQFNKGIIFRFSNLN